MDITTLEAVRDKLEKLQDMYRGMSAVKGVTASLLKVKMMIDEEATKRNTPTWVKCPEGHIDTYLHNAEGIGLLVMCNICEDGYEINQQEH